MRSLTVGLLLSFVALITFPVMAHDVTITGTNSFASLDGSSSDHDGAANGVFTVNDGNLVVNGVVNCNDDTGASDSACAMAFAVSGNMSIGTGGALYAENRTGSGNGGAITLTVGGGLTMSGNAIVSTASKSSSGATGGAITATVNGAVTIGSGTTVDSGSANARGGAIAIAAGGLVTVNGNVLSGPSRTILSTRLEGGPALDGGTSNTIGGSITISSSAFSEPAIVISATANIVSQGADAGAGPVTIDGCGITVRGLIAALSRKDGAAKISIRSGKDVLIDGRDLGAAGIRMGRVRADAPSGTAVNKGVDIFAAETVDIYGPATGLFTITSLPGLHDTKSYGGLIRITSLGDAVNGSGNMIDDGHSASGDSGGTIAIAAKEDVNLNTAVIRAVGDFNTNNPNRGGGSIQIRSYSGDVIWTNGTGEVRPVGSTSNLPLADQGSIVLTACGTVNTTGSSFPVMGTATSVFPETHTGVCSPAAPSLPVGVPPLITCNTPPVANDASATTNEDTTVTITLSGSDADGDPLTFSIVSGPSHGTLGAIIPTGPTTATVNYSPAANYNGSDSFVYRANDGNGGTDDATVSLTVVAVNDAPSFLAGPSKTVLEDSGAQSYPNWATSISAGPTDESGQTVTFTVIAGTPSLFSVQPAVSSNGTLTFKPAANASGSSSITITAHDNGGTANGGVDTSAPQTSSITITAVNDEPSFTGGGNVTVNEDSGPYSAAWASSISAGPGESGQSVTFTVSNDNNGLFSVQPAVSPTGVLTFTPAANVSGTVNVSVTLHDDGGTADGGDDTSGAQPFVITINAVNDAPSFTGGGDVSVLEDSGAYSGPWASSISAGPGESGQSVSFSVTNSNNSLFAVQPAIDPSGNLNFTVAANANGPATVTVTLSDNGGTANGGVATSAPQTFTINITAVNDAPSFTSSGNVTVNEDSGAYSAPWASAISAGPHESGQTVTFFASNNQNALFSVQPSINSAGVLTFTPAPNAFGTATVTVFAKDNGGTANGGVDTSGSVTFDIIINGVNDGPTVANDSWETEGNTELRVDHGASLTPHVADTTPSGRGVLDNDADTVEGDPVVVTGVVGCADTTAPFVCSVTGGTLTLEANGTFTFQPSAGATSASFQYTAADQPSAGAPVSATGSVTITIHDMIWYVNGAAAAGGDGTSASPFNGFAPLDGSGDVDGAGDYIFVHTSAVSGTIALEPQQKLWGQGVGLIIPRNLNGNGSPATLVAPGVRPTVTSVTDTVTITGVPGVEVAGLAITSAGGNGIDVSSPVFGGIASASIYSNSITAGTEGIDITSFNTGTTNVFINATDIISAGNGVDVTGGDGTVVFSYGNGTITSTGGDGIFGDGSSLTALIVSGLSNVTVTGPTAGNGISLQFAKFDANPGTPAFDTVNAGAASIGTSVDPVGGNAVVLSSTSGSLAFGSLSAHGSTDAVTIAGGGLFTGSGGMQVTSGGGALSAAAGTGLSVTNASIGSANLSFTSISATGGANGIVLNNTGTSGGLKVLGTGTAGSGGTISSTSGHGVSLTSTALAAFNNLSIQNTAGSGVKGTSVTNFAYTNGSINNSGTGGGADESNIAFNGSAGMNVSGTLTITGNTLTNALWHGVDIRNLGGTLSNVNVSGNTITSSTSTATSNGSGVRVLIGGTASTVAHLTRGSFSNNVITNFPSGGGILVNGGNSNSAGSAGTLGVAGSGTDIVTISGNTIRGQSAAVRMGTNAIGATVSGRGQANFAITGNGTVAAPLTNITGIVISVAANGFANATVTTANNVIVANNSVASGGIAGGTGITFTTADSPSLDWIITGNSISATDGNGILAVARSATGLLKLKVQNNTVAAPLTGVRQGIRVDAGNTASINDSVCLNISGNTSAGSGGATGIGLRKQGTNTAVNAFGIHGLPSSPAGTPVVETYVDSQNPAGGGTQLLSATTGFTACANP
jgi:hypothetical protein